MTDILTSASASALLARVTKLLQSISEASAHFLRLFGCIMPRKPGTQALLCADDKDKKRRYEEYCQQGTTEHATEYASTDCMLSFGAGAARKH